MCVTQNHGTGGCRMLQSDNALGVLTGSCETRCCNIMNNCPGTFRGSVVLMTTLNFIALKQGQTKLRRKMKT